MPKTVNHGVIARSDRVLLYRCGPEDSLRTLARQFLGDESRSFEIAELNDTKVLNPGSVVAIPLRPVNVTGVRPNTYQTVPILTYHRFGAKAGKMVVSPENFALQLQYLADHDYQVITLSALQGFLQSRRPLPRRSAVITIDDGYASTYQHALPLLRKFGFPATVFVYTDFVGAGDALNWAQMREMMDTGLIDIQSHTKAHTNLADMQPEESDERYRARVDTELRSARDLLRTRLGKPVTTLAYPFGAANAFVMQRAGLAGYALAMTVDPGGNPFFAPPLLLHRTMIFGDHDLDDFAARLQTQKEVAIP